MSWTPVMQFFSSLAEVRRMVHELLDLNHVEDVADQPVDAPHLAEDVPDVLVLLRRYPAGPFQVLDPRDDSGERIPDFVRHARREAAERGELVEVHDLLFHAFDPRDVDEDGDRPLDALLLVDEERRVQDDRELRPVLLGEEHFPLEDLLPAPQRPRHRSFPSAPQRIDDDIVDEHPLELIGGVSGELLRRFVDQTDRALNIRGDRDRSSCC